MMITIVHPHIETPLIVSEDCVQILIIENPQEFYQTVTELIGEFGGEEGDFVFTERGKRISPSDAGDIVENIFALDLNGKKQINLLYKVLEKQANERQDGVLLNGVNREVSKFLRGVFEDLPFALTFEELTPADVFKSAEVKFEEIYESLLEKIICYINEMIVLKKCRFFVFVNLKSVLNDEQLQALYYHCQKEKVGLFLLESGKPRSALTGERTVLISEDLCEIIA